MNRCEDLQGQPGQALDVLTTRPAVDRRRSGPRPRGRSSTPGPSRHGPHTGKLVRPSTLLTMPATAGCRAGQALDVAHHAGDDRSPRGRLWIDVDQGHGRGDDPRHAHRPAADRRGPGDAFTTRPVADRRGPRRASGGISSPWPASAHESFFRSFPRSASRGVTSSGAL